MRLWGILKKELIQLIKNPKMRMTLLVPPMMQLIMLGYAATLELKQVDLGILDHSRSAASRELTARFAGSPTFHLHPPLASEKEMGEKIGRRTIKTALVFPENFEKAIQGRKRPEVQVIVDGRSAGSAGLANAYIQNIVSGFFMEKIGSENGTGMAGGPEIRSRAWFNPNYDARLFMVPAVLAMIALIDMILLNALSMSKEREEGTFDQLRLTPAATWEILTAKGLAAVFVGSLQLAMGLIVVRYWFGVPLMSSGFLLAGLLLSFLFASMGIGLLVSVLSRNLQQSILGAFVVIMPFAMLSGLSTPAESMPDLFQTLSLANPLRHGVSALPRIFLEGTTFGELRWSFFFLWGIAAVCFGLACLIFHRQRQGG
ncbi:MAG: ABC transporter permease [Planctomycetia bacterium]|nr:ABC transporter permease [Planctomycetia bacterium]